MLKVDFYFYLLSILSHIYTLSSTAFCYFLLNFFFRYKKHSVLVKLYHKSNVATESTEFSEQCDCNVSGAAVQTTKLVQTKHIEIMAEKEN